MSDEQKRPSLSDERFANWCVDSFEDQKDRYHAFVGEQSRWIDVLESRLRVSEAEHQAKVREIEANELKAIKLAEKVVGENAKIKTEIEDLKLTCSKQIYWEQESKITALRERLEAIKQHLEQMPKENQSIYWTSICDDEIQDEFISHKFFTDLQKWYQELGVLLAHDEKTVPIGDCGDKEILKVESKSEGKK